VSLSPSVGSDAAADALTAFGRILKQLVERVPGAIGAIFADWEGEAIDHFAHMPSFDMKLVGAHWGVVLGQIDDRFAQRGAGAIEELVIECAEAYILVRPVTAHYYVVLQGTRAGLHLGTARRELDRSAATLIGEM
jgi:predicted regulator of Ras-like GTPase activity (Roadblock/LC7/MglB family)